jgi:hypothetical protein
VRRSTEVFVAFLSVVACDGSGGSLLVDLRTDYVPGVEIDRVQTLHSRERFDVDPTGDIVEAAAITSADYLAGVRIATLDGVEPGTHWIRVTLLLGETEVDRADVVTTVRGTTGVTVVMSRLCRGVSCPAPGDPPTYERCVSGRCVDPACAPETPEGCGMICAADSECSGEGARALAGPDAAGTTPAT